MTNPHVRFWIACFLAAGLAFSAAYFLTAIAYFLMFPIFCATLVWFVIGYDKAVGGLYNISSIRVVTVGTVATIAIFFACAFGAVFGFGVLTRFRS